MLLDATILSATTLKNHGKICPACGQQALTLNLATRSREDIIRFLQPFTHPALDEREDLQLDYFDDVTRFNKFDTAIPRCVYCLASPATEKLDGLLQPGARPSFLASVARLLRRKAAVNAEAWLHNHYRNYHFTCCQEHPCSDIDTFAICQVEHILAQKDGKVPRHFPTFGLGWLLRLSVRRGSSRSSQGAWGPRRQETSIDDRH